MDYYGLLRIIMDYYGLLWIIIKFKISALKNDKLLKISEC